MDNGQWIMENEQPKSIINYQLSIINYLGGRMCWLDKSKEILKEKKFWAPHERVQLWTNADNSRRAYLEREGGYITIFLYAASERLEDGFNAGMVTNTKTGEAEYMLMLNKESYAAWTEAVRPKLVRAEMRRVRYEQNNGPALWVRSPKGATP